MPLPLPLLLTLFTVFLYESAYQAAGPIVALHLQGLGATPRGIGLTLAAAGFVPMLLAMPTGSLVDRFGSGRMAMAGTGVMAAAYGALYAAPNLALAAACISLMQMGFSAAIVSCQSFTASFGRREQREQHLGYHGVAVGTGQLAGPLLGGLLAERFGFGAAFLAAGGLAFLGTLAATRLPRQAQRQPQGFHPLKGLTLLQRPGMRFALLSALLILPAMDIRSAFQPVFLADEGVSPAQIGLLFTIHGMAAILIRFGIGRLVHRFGHFRLLAAGMILATSALALIPLLPLLWAQAVFAAILGAAVGFTQPLTIALTASAAPAQDRGLALGMRMTANRLGGVVSPLALGLTAGAFGLASVFYAAALSTLAGALVAVRAGRRDG